MTVVTANRTTTMKAFTRTEYGSPDVLELRDVEKPSPGADEVLVRVQAASVNPVDWHELTGEPYVLRLQEGLRRPKSERLGADFAGTVEVVGSSVTRFRPGDEVFGVRNGAFAEYLVVKEDRAVAPKPASMTFEQAAAVGVAALTALQGLRDKGQIRAGHNVLINGASGGVGTFAVQIAKSFGAHVTGVCSTPNVETARSLGADEVVDYMREDFTRSERRYHLVLDIAGNRSWSELKRILADEARLVVVGGPKNNRWIGPIGGMVKVRMLSMGGSQSVVSFLAEPDRDDLETLWELLEAGSVTPVIDRRYELGELREALSYLAEGRARGKGRHRRLTRSLRLRLVGWIGRDVVGDEVFQRFDLLEELLRRYLPLDRVTAEDVGRRLDRGAPRDLVRPLLVLRSGGLFRERLDRVEVHVREVALLRLVELDSRTLTLCGERLTRDRFLEGGVFAAAVVDQNETRVPRLRLVRLDALDVDDCFRHVVQVPRAPQPGTSSASIRLFARGRLAQGGEGREVVPSAGDCSRSIRRRHRRRDERQSSRS
jgi:NADPH:quinone reductase-like Zn-dependent oxidoreductase